MHLMLATDGSDAARTAEAWIIGSRWKPDTLVDIVCVARGHGPRPGWSLQTYRPAVRAAVDGLAEFEVFGAQSIANESGRRLQAAGLAVRTWAARGDPASELVGMATRERPDLLVLGPRGRKGWASVLLGSVSDEVIAQAAVPVLLARPTLTRRSGVPREVGVLLDAGCMERAALAWLGESGWTDIARIVVIAVSHPIDHEHDDLPPQGAGALRSASDLIADHLPGSVVRVARVDDSSTEAILETVAALDVDLLVLARSRSRDCEVAAADIATGSTRSTVIVPATARADSRRAA